jgi:hypothetical protein
MLDFQPTTMAFPIGSILATQANEAQEVSKEMEINSHKTDINISIETQEEPCSQPQPKLQPDFGMEGKVTKIQKVLVEKVKDSPQRLQLEGAHSGAVKLIIELPHDPIR